MLKVLSLFQSICFRRYKIQNLFLNVCFHGFCNYTGFLKHHDVFYLMGKSYTSVKTSRVCWNCNRSILCVDFFCECGAIQPLDESRNYFDLFGYSDFQISIDSNDLSDRMKKLQRILHPDKFTGKSEYEQVISSDISALVNKAFLILQKPLTRYEYILFLNGFADQLESPVQNDIDFLINIMDLNEEMERILNMLYSDKKNNVELSTGLENLIQNVYAKMKEQESGIIEKLNNSDWLDSVLFVSRYKYLLKILESINEHELEWKKLGINVNIKF